MKMARNLKDSKGKYESIVWIELPPPEDARHADQLCRKLNRMLKRLAKPEDLRDGELPRSFFYARIQRCYCYGGAMGFVTLSDRGEWFNLDYLAGEA
jgi:hypothetical protein